MLVKKDCTGKKGSVYICDRCGDEMIVDERYRVSIQKSKKSNYKSLRSWDFCLKCFKLLCKSVEKNGEKENKNSYVYDSNMKTIKELKERSRRSRVN